MIGTYTLGVQSQCFCNSQCFCYSKSDSHVQEGLCPQVCTAISTHRLLLQQQQGCSPPPPSPQALGCAGTALGSAALATPSLRNEIGNNLSPDSKTIICCDRNSSLTPWGQVQPCGSTSMAPTGMTVDLCGSCGPLDPLLGQEPAAPVQALPFYSAI